MIQETGIIVETSEPDLARVRCIRSSACDHCEAKGACHTGHAGEERIVVAVNRIGARPGDRVVVAIGSGAFLRSSFLVYIVPLLALVACSLVGQMLGPRLWPALNSELVTALFGIAGMVLGFAGVRLRQKRFDDRRYLPQVIGFAVEHESAKGHGH